MLSGPPTTIFLRETGANLKLFATGYETQEDVWAAIQEDSNLVVVDSLALPSRGGFSGDDISFELEVFFYDDT